MSQPPSGPRNPQRDPRHARETRPRPRPPLQQASQQPAFSAADRKRPHNYDIDDNPTYSRQRTNARGDYYRPQTSDQAIPMTPGSQTQASGPRNTMATERTPAPSTPAPTFSLPIRPNPAARVGLSSTMPMRGPEPHMSVYSAHVSSSDSVRAPSVDPAIVNAAVHRSTRAPRTGLRRNGTQASPRHFLPGAIFWGPHHVTAMHPKPNPLLDRDFVQTNVSIACCKRRMFFIDFAHDDGGLQAFPMFTHGHNGLKNMPEHMLRYHIPVIDWNDSEYVPWHPNYRPVQARRYDGATIGNDVSIDISMSYPLHFREDLTPAGWTTLEGSNYVFHMADGLRAHGRRATLHFANRVREATGSRH